AILVLNCFLFSFCYGPSIAAVIDGKQAAKEYKQIFDDFILPYAYGKITDSHFASSDRVIINIQDLHCHPKVQKNIGKIIELFDKKCGVTNIFLEGAYGDIDTSWLTGEKNAAQREKLLDLMLETGRLTGAEYFSALKYRSDIIKGLESKNPYLQNLNTFGRIIEEQEDIDIILAGIEESMSDLKKRYYNKRQFKLEKLSKEYSENKIPQRKYFTLLSKHTKKLGIDLDKYSNTRLYLEILNSDKELDYKAIGLQLQQFVAILKDKIPYGAYKMLLDSTSNFTEVDKLYGYLIDLSKKIDIDLSVDYGELNKYFKYIELSQKINPLELVSEEQRLSSEINSRFAETKSQREVVFLIGFHKYLKNFLNSKITASDYKYYQDNIDKYRKLYVKYIDNKVLSLLDDYIKRAQDFYDINLQRNGYFSQNLFESIKSSPLENPTAFHDDASSVINNLNQVKRVDVIITGGFHTEALSDILKERNISYVVITPNITDGVKEAQETYYKVAKEQSKISSQTLANMVASLSITDQIKLWLSVDPQKALDIYGNYLEINGNTAVIKDSGISFSLDKDGKFRLDSLPSSTKEEKARKQLIAQAAKIFESDDETTGDIIAAVIEKIKENLTNKELAGKVTPELLEKMNFNEVKKALEDDIASLEHIVENTVNEKSALISGLRLFSQMLGKLSDAVVENAQSIQKSAVEMQIEETLLNETENADSGGFLTGNKISLNAKQNRNLLIETETGVYCVLIDKGSIVILIKEENGQATRTLEYMSAQDLYKLTGVDILYNNIAGNERVIISKNNDSIRIAALEGNAKVNLDKLENIDTSKDLPAAKAIFAEQMPNIFYLDEIEEIVKAISSNKPVAVYPYRWKVDVNNLPIQDINNLLRAILSDTKHFNAFEYNLREMFKNAFVHGNKLDFNKPVYIQKTQEGDISVYNVIDDKEDGDSNKNVNVRKTIAALNGITGGHNGVINIAKTQKFTAGQMEIGGIKFYKATAYGLSDNNSIKTVKGVVGKIISIFLIAVSLAFAPLNISAQNADTLDKAQTSAFVTRSPNTVINFPAKDIMQAIGYGSIVEDSLLNESNIENS
ncbi:MAG: hypothetical protein LBQ47_07035, partial [Endomicrobium sp.]|nr:hypothetical protein [Endomicrobium sp.]